MGWFRAYWVWYAIGAIAFALAWAAPARLYRAQRRVAVVTAVAAFVIAPMPLWAPGDGGVVVPAGLVFLSGLRQPFTRLGRAYFDIWDLLGFLLATALPILVVWGLLYVTARAVARARRVRAPVRGDQEATGRKGD